MDELLIKEETVRRGQGTSLHQSHPHHHSLHQKRLHTTCSPCPYTKNCLLSSRRQQVHQTRLHDHLWHNLPNHQTQVQTLRKTIWHTHRHPLHLPQLWIHGVPQRQPQGYREVVRRAQKFDESIQLPRFVQSWEETRKGQLCHCVPGSQSERSEESSHQGLREVGHLLSIKR